MKIKWKLIFILFIVSVLYMHCSAQDSSYQPVMPQTIYYPTERITVFPNPLPPNSDFNIEIDLVKDYYLARILVYSLSNRIIKDEVVKVQKGDNRFTISMGGFEQGNYVVKVFAKKDKPSSYTNQLVIR